MEVIASDNEIVSTGEQEHRHLPMQSQITLMFMAVMLIFAVSASLINSWITVLNHSAENEEKVRAYARHIHLELDEHYHDQDYYGLKQSIKGVLHGKEVQSVLVFDEQGEVVVNSANISNPDAMYQTIDKRVKEQFIHNESSIQYIEYFSDIHAIHNDVGLPYPASPADEPVIKKSGYILVSIASGDVFKEGFSTFLWTFFIATVAAVIISFIAVVVVRRFAQPFNQLAMAMLGAQSGEQGVRVYPDGAREIFDMANAFNSMMHVLELRESRLLSQKNELELRVSEREKAENELRHQTTRLEAVISNSMDGVLVVGPDLKILSLNPAAEYIFSCSADELGDESLQKILPGIFENNQQLALGQYESEAISLYGDTIAVDVCVSTMLIEDIKHFLVTVRDISERKKNEEDLRHYRENLEDMVEEQTRDIAEARDAALAGERAMSAFLANMSHEIRTPLHGVLSFAAIGMKKNGKVSEERIAGFFNEIKNSGEYLLDILNDLLDLSKLKSGKMKYQYSLSSLINVFECVIREFSVLSTDKGLHATINITGDETDVYIDVARITQVVRNLYSNAIKYSDENSELIFEVDFASPPDVTFSLANTGTDIPEDELESIFESFSQSSATSTDSGGTGLGLSICKEIVETGHNGRIFAESRGGNSVRFVVNIPVDAREIQEQ